LTGILLSIAPPSKTLGILNPPSANAFCEHRTNIKNRKLKNLKHGLISKKDNSLTKEILKNGLN
jgi:hypothetical protein